MISYEVNVAVMASSVLLLKKSPLLTLPRVIALTLVNSEPSPKNLTAVTELIPDIFVALSPIIFPFALISKVIFT